MACGLGRKVQARQGAVQVSSAATNSDPAKPLHMVVDMEDPEEVEGVAGEFYGGPEEEMGV